MRVKKYLLLGIMTASILVSGNKVQAAEKSCRVPLEEEGKNYYVDLDGDNKAEKIRYETTWIEDSEGSVLGHKLTLYVNNQVKTVKRMQKGASHADWKVSIYNFNTKDKYREIEIYSDYWGDIIHNVYRYKGKKIQEYFSMPRSWLKQGIRIYSTQPGDGKVTMYYKGGRFDAKLEKGELKRIGKENEYVMNGKLKGYIRDINVKRTPNTSEIQFVLSFEDVANGVILKKVLLQNNEFTYGYIELNDGRSGWVFLSDVDFLMYSIVGE